MAEPLDGRTPVERPGFTYLPAFVDKQEGQALIDYVAGLAPLWEERHRGDTGARSQGQSRRLTRPVYWLGAWQFACLGYYAEPDHREHRCLRADPMPPVLLAILERLRPEIARHGNRTLPNTCLINFYGREVGDGPPRDFARLRMHRDSEPGPVVMFCIGQAGLLEFVDPQRTDDPELSLWTRHRGITILSGAEYKDRLYHRIARVRTGAIPQMPCRLPNFELRRVSFSFRYVPEECIGDFGDLPAPARDKIRDYVEVLAERSSVFREQLGSPEP